MKLSLVLFYAMVSACSSMAYARPTITGDMIKTMAKITIARIKKIKAEHFNMSPEISFGTFEDTPIEGLTSIVGHLSSLLARLRVPPAHHLRQVEEDVDTLLGHLRGTAISQGCTLPKAGSTLLKSETDFPITSNYLSLLDLQRYLEKLCLNLDKLKPC
ncbi:leptin b [Alosa pseudoharengus]|uniref:leptin b n=1 Tax=Alosa pseudoharengus TaxID=34774 RepID=UPI003F8B6146